MTCQPLRVLFISSVTLSGINHIAHLQFESEAVATVGVACPPRCAGWLDAAASALESSEPSCSMTFPSASKLLLFGPALGATIGLAVR